MRMIRTNKKGALELSIGTIVILVIAMSMLVLGIILVNKILGGATDSVDTLNDKVKGEINNLFSKEGSKITVLLGADRRARIESGSGIFGIGIGGKSKDGALAETLEYKLILQGVSDSPDNCIARNSESEVKDFFKSPTDVWLDFDEWEGSSAFAIVELDIPDGTILCSQKVFVEIQDSADAGTFAKTFFIFEIQEAGFF
jgi:hypothetical protein